VADGRYYENRNQRNQDIGILKGETNGFSKESRPKGPGFGYPQRGFALLEVH